MLIFIFSQKTRAWLMMTNIMPADDLVMLEAISLLAMVLIQFPWHILEQVQPKYFLITSEGSSQYKDVILPDETKPLPEPMLIYHQYGPLLFIWVQFYMTYFSHQSLKLAGKWLSKNFFEISQGPMSWSQSVCIQGPNMAIDIHAGGLALSGAGSSTGI